MSTLFIADLHLSGEQPATAELFLRFLQEQASQADALYILGDLFEVWLGDDLIPAEVEPLLAALRQLGERGIPLYVMHGNRDFLLGQRFAELSGATLLDDPCVIDLYNTPTLLMHGDLLCTDDTAYQKMRSMLRNPQWIAEFLARSAEDRIAFARSLRERSEKETGEKAYAIMDINADTLQRYLQRYGVSRVIHGHTHRPAFHHEGAAERYVVGAWHESAKIVRCDRSGCRLETV